MTITKCDRCKTESGQFVYNVSMWDGSDGFCLDHELCVPCADLLAAMNKTFLEGLK